MLKFFEVTVFRFFSSVEMFTRRAFVSEMRLISSSIKSINILCFFTLCKLKRKKNRRQYLNKNGKNTVKMCI